MTSNEQPSRAEIEDQTVVWLAKELKQLGFSVKEWVPIFLWFLGTIAPERVTASQRPGAEPLPSLHSDQFYPIPEPSICTGVLTMSMAVLNLVGK